MQVEITEVPIDDWSSVADDAYFATFGFYNSTGDRADYSLVAYTENSKPVGFILCQEYTSKKVYWQLGGFFSDAPKILRYRILQRGLEEQLKKYDKICTKVYADNKAMLTMHLKLGFNIVGCALSNGIVLLELEIGRS